MSDWIFYAIMGFGVLIASISQMLLKKAAQKQYSHWIRQYLNPLVISGYFIMVLSTVCTVIAMRRIPLTTTPIWNSSGIIFVAILGSIFFKEKISRKKLLGLIIVIAGIVIFSL